MCWECYSVYPGMCGLGVYCCRHQQENKTLMGGGGGGGEGNGG